MTHAETLLAAVQANLPDSIECFAAEILHTETVDGNMMIFRMLFTAPAIRRYVNVYLDEIPKGEKLQKWGEDMARQIKVGLPCH